MGSMRRLNIAPPEFSYDQGDPEGFRSGMLRLGPLLGASVYEIAPGQAICPFHYEYAEEEWLLVLEGRPTVRHAEGEEELAPWDVVCFPKGPDGVHGVRNPTDGAVRVLMFSNVAHPAATVYPDSDKIAIWTGNKADDLIARRGDGVGYYEGEGG